MVRQAAGRGQQRCNVAAFQFRGHEHERRHVVNPVAIRTSPPVG
jgi:hypothetical protein